MTKTTSPAVQHPAEVSGHRFRSSRLWRLLPKGMRRRWWLFRAFDILARRWPVPGRRRGLAVVRMDGIGDMILFRGSLDHYAEAFGVAKDDITVIGCDSWAPIAGEVFAGYHFISINEHRFAKRPWYRFRVALKVRRLNAETVVCDQFFRRAMMADSLVWISGAPNSVVALPYINEPTRGEYGWYMTQVLGVIDTGLYPTHEVLRHAAFVSAVAGREIAPAPPRIAWRDKTPEVAAAGPYVVLNPGSNEYGRRWPLKDYCEIARKLREQGLRAVFIGSAKEKPDWDFMTEFGGDEGVVDLMGKTDLPGLLDVMRHATAVLTNDTGPAHVAIALGTPTLVVVGGGHFGSFVPYPDGARPEHARFVWRHMDCYHCIWRCHKRESKRDSFPCVAAVTVEQVWDELVQLLPEGD